MNQRIKIKSTKILNFKFKLKMEFEACHSAQYTEHLQVIEKYTLEPFLNVLVSVTACIAQTVLFRAAGHAQKQKPRSPNLVLVLGRT